MIVYIYNLKTNEKERVYKRVLAIHHTEKAWFIEYLSDSFEIIQTLVSKENRKIVAYGF